jgi:hypothetical protein
MDGNAAVFVAFCVDDANAPIFCAREVQDLLGCYSSQH